MTITAYVQGSKNPAKIGNLGDGGTLIVEGATYDIPPNTFRGDRPAEDRISEVLRAAGYRLAGAYVYSVEPPATNGVFKVRVTKV